MSAPEICHYNLQEHVLPLKSISGILSDTFKEPLAEELLRAIHIEKLKRKIRSLQQKVILVDSSNSWDELSEDGHVCVCRLTVKTSSEHPEVQELETDLETFSKFDQFPRAFLVSSDSVNVIDSKLCVYKTFKNLLDCSNIRIHHELDPSSTLGVYCAKHIMDDFIEQMEKLVESIPIDEIENIVEEAANIAFTDKEIEERCQNVNLDYDGEQIGRAQDVTYSCRAPWTIYRIKKSLVSKTLESVTKNFTDLVLLGILKQIARKLEIAITEETLKWKHLIDARKIILSVSLLAGGIPVGFAAGRIAASFFHPALGTIVNVVVVSSFVVKAVWTVIVPIDVNSREWRDKIANEVHKDIISKKKEIITKITKEMTQVCRNTKTELSEIIEDLSSFSNNISLIDQKKLIEEWMLRDFRIKNVELCPSILHFIAGRKNGNTVMKVFLQGNENEAKEFCYDNLENSPKNVVFEFVDINLKSDSKNVTVNNRHSTHISENMKEHINSIIREERDSIFAKHSNVIGIGMSPVKYSGGHVVHAPCISIYCLDANLIPFGEEEIPKFLKDIPCDILEDFFLFGSCENCPALDHGCSIGKKGEKSSGTLGFFVKRSNDSGDSYNGFLTAAHVALTDGIIKNLYGRRLSDSDLRNELFDIVHPSFEDSNANKVIGKVKDSFFGNFKSIGIDAAFVKTDDIQHELSDEIRNQPFSITDYPEERDRVVKNGRTTGKTTGIWLRQCPLSVKRLPQRYKGVYFPLYDCLCIENEGTQSFFELGDSGAAVYLTNEGNIQQPLGLAFGKTTSLLLPSITLACPIKSVLEVLQLSIFEPAQPMEIP